MPVTSILGALGDICRPSNYMWCRRTNFMIATGAPIGFGCRSTGQFANMPLTIRVYFDDRRVTRERPGIVDRPPVFASHTAHFPDSRW